MGIRKKNGHFIVRLPIRVDPHHPWSACRDFFGGGQKTGGFGPKNTVAKDCLLTLVKSRLALGSHDCLVIPSGVT